MKKKNFEFSLKIGGVQTFAYIYRVKRFLSIGRPMRAVGLQDSCPALPNIAIQGDSCALR